jgi:sec-independent protein translocase protein TatB
MFDIGFSELVVVALVALIVIGPERLPRVARTAGALLGRAQRYINDVKADIQREVDMSELSGIRDSFKDAANSMKESVAEVGQELKATGESLNQSISEAAEAKAEPAATEPSADEEVPAVSAPTEPSAAEEDPAVSAQLDLVLETKPAADPATAPKA